MFQMNILQKASFHFALGSCCFITQTNKPPQLYLNTKKSVLHMKDIIYTLGLHLTLETFYQTSGDAKVFIRLFKNMQLDSQ